MSGRASFTSDEAAAISRSPMYWPKCTSESWTSVYPSSARGSPGIRTTTSSMV